jgi:hypothetical protein
VGTRLVKIVLSESAHVDIIGTIQDRFRSWRTSTLLGTFSLRIGARNLAREGMPPRGRAGRSLARGRPLQVITTSPSLATISSRCERADRISWMFRVFTCFLVEVPR